MKKIITLLLCALAFTVCLCACDKATEQTKNPDDTEVFGTPNALAPTDESVGRTSTPITTPTIAPTPEPTPTPFPDTDVSAVDDEYGFVYCATCDVIHAPDGSGVVTATLAKNDDIKIVGKHDDDFYKVESGNNVGYMSVNDVAIADGYITADEVKLREGASRKYDVKCVTEINTELFILKVANDEWYKVVLNDEAHTMGYMHRDYVSYKNGYTSKSANIRSIPDASGDKVTTLDSGKRISILFEYNGWYKIETSDYVGYMSAEFVEYTPTVIRLEKQRAYINASGVNFREAPAVDGAIIDKFYKYGPVYVVGETDEWYCVTSEGKDDEIREGYVSKDFVVLGTPSVYVTGQDVNLRSGPGTGYDLLTKVRQNSEFIIIAYEDDEWYKGEVNGNVGYIRGDYLSTSPVGDGKSENEFTRSEVYLAAKVVYLEAKGGGASAYRAVANVIYNRVKSWRFPNDIEGVVLQRNQFSVVNHSNFDSVEPNSDAYEATREVLNGGLRPLPFNVLFFHADFLGKSWGSEKEYYGQYGDNLFFRYVG